MHYEVREYTKRAREKGLSDVEIRQNLLNNGWDVSEVDEALGAGRVSGGPVETGSLGQESKEAEEVAEPNVGSILQNVWERIVQRSGQLLVVTAASVLLTAGVVALVLGFARSIGSAYFFMEAIEGGYIGYFIGYFLVAGVVMLVVFQYFLTVVTVILGKEPHSLKEVLRIAWGRLFPVIVASIAVGAIMMAGFIFFIIPGIIAYTMLSMTVYAVVLDRMSSWDAIQYSRSLTKGYRGLILVTLVTSAIAGEVVGSIVNYVPSMLLEQPVPGMLTGLLSGLSLLIMLLVAVAKQLFVTAVGVVLYEKLKLLPRK
jgi:hypothetical protein